MAQCCFNVRPTSATLADNIPTFGECVVLAEKALTANMLGVNCFQMRELVNYPLKDVGQVYRVYVI